MLKKLKSLFIVEDESAAKSAPAKSPAKPAKAKAKPKTNTGMVEPVRKPNQSPTAPKVQNTGKADPKFVDVLLKAIEANNIDGFDYLEFKQSLQSMSNLDMDEKTKYQSAFAMAKTMGATPTKLVSSAKHYVNILRKEESKFSDALKNQRQRQVQDRENGIKQLENSIVEKQKQIKQLEAQIEDHKKQLAEKRETINTAVAKVENTKNGFVNAYNKVMGQIEADIQKMNQYIS